MYGPPSVEPEYAAKVDGKKLLVRIGTEGTVWTWDDGQRVLALSSEAIEWAEEHIVKSQRKAARASMYGRGLRPSSMAVTR